MKCDDKVPIIFFPLLCMKIREIPIENVQRWNS